MKHKLSKKQIMNSYYSDEELKEMMKMSASRALRWLAQANRFFNKALSKKQKRLREQMIVEGW
ncbi:hypothetical protein ACFL52_02575 [Candidatus Margulisiibacteriota bacterium]